MDWLTRVYERFKLFLRIIFINKKYTLVAFIGLGISLALIAENLIFLYSFQYAAFNSFVTDNPEEQITVSPANMFNTLGIEETIIPDLQAIMDQALMLSNLEGRVTTRDWLNHRTTLLPYRDSENNTGLLIESLVGAPITYLSALEPYLLPGGRMPSNPKEMIAVVRSDRLTEMNISIGICNLYIVASLFNLELSVEYGIPAAGAVMNITGIIDVYQLQTALANQLQTDINSTRIKNLFSVMNSDEMLITTLGNVIDFISGLTGPETQVAPHRAAFVGTILFNLNEIDAFNIQQEIANIISLTERLRTSIEMTDLTNEVHINLDLIYILQDFAREFEIFRIFILLFMVPIIGMALALTAYSANLIKKRRKRQLAHLRQRGSSRQAIIAMLISELITFTIVAISLGFLIGYPFSFLVMKSDGFLSFRGATVTPQLYLIVIEVVIIAGFVGALAINIRNIWNMSKIAQEEAFSELEEKKSFWEKYYIDIFFLILGVGAWLITTLQLRNADVSTEFAYIIGAPAPIFLLVGSILLITRIYPLITKLLSKITWKFRKLEIVSVSCRSISRRKAGTMRSLILIMLTFTLTVASIILPDSYQAFDYENANYSLGSDIIISGLSMNDQALRSNIEAAEGVEATTYVTWLSPMPVTRGSLTFSYTIMGINVSEFINVGYLEDEYVDGKLEEVLAKLAEPTDEGVIMNVLVQKKQIEPFAITEGETIDIYYEYWYGSELQEENYTVRVVDFYNYWPKIYIDEPNPASTNFRLSLVTNLMDIYKLTRDASDVYVQMFVKVSEGHSIARVANEIEETTFRQRVENTDELVLISRGSLRSTVLFGSLNANFIAAIVILISSVALMMIIHTIERVHEVAIMRAIGISPQQLFVYFFTESFTVIVVGAIAGIALGILSSYMFMSILAINTFIPPWEMVFPIGKLALTIVALFASSIVSAAIPGIISANKIEATIMRQI